MSKPKYPFEKRLEVVNHYFTTDDGYRIISARFGVPRTQVRTIRVNSSIPYRG
ncbi:transposase [Escherichia coli]|nr:transposase [Escherichia coli]EFL8127529.1 transposase [Escherichia coli]